MCHSTQICEIMIFHKVVAPHCRLANQMSLPIIFFYGARTHAWCINDFNVKWRIGSPWCWRARIICKRTLVRGGNSDLGLLNEVPPTESVPASSPVTCVCKRTGHRLSTMVVVGATVRLYNLGKNRSVHACHTLQPKNKFLERFRTNSSDKSRWTIRYLVELRVNGGITRLLDEPQLKCKSARDICSHLRDFSLAVEV